MAVHARHGRQAVIVVDMALRAHSGDVYTSQGKSCGCVVKDDRGPGSRRVAQLTGRRSSGRQVIGAGGVIEIRHVARGAIRGQCRLVARVALTAGNRRMRSGKREAGFRVIELCPGPLRGRMTCGTIRGKTRFYMTGVCRLVEVLQMASGAVGGRTGELAPYVALVASHIDMGAGQRKLCCSVVIELCVAPGNCGMADPAGIGEAGRGMVGISGVVEILQVATHAIG